MHLIFTASLALAADITFVETTIEAELGDVIDESSSGGFKPSTISAKLDALVADVDPACSVEQWAGTWVRNRPTRLAGATEGGGVVSGPSILDGDVDGTPFSASLQSYGRFVGATDADTTVRGQFARINSRRAIWYGIEIDCAPEPPADLFVERNLEIVGNPTLLGGDSLFVSDLTVAPAGGVLEAVRLRTTSIQTPSTCAMNPHVRNASNLVLAVGDAVLVGDEREITLPLSSPLPLLPGEVLRVGAEFSGCNVVYVPSQELSPSVGTLTFIASDGREFPNPVGVAMWGE